MSNQDKNQLVESQLIDLASDRPELYQAAYTWFTQQGPAITSALVQGLDNEYLGSVGHWRILLLLQHFAQKETLPAILKTLQRALSRRNNVVIPAAMEAITVFHTPVVTNTLIDLLQDNDLDIVKQAAVLLGKTDDLNAIEPLLNLLGSNDPTIRYRAVRGLSQLNYPLAQEALK
ncbi:MAG: hypothetical protein AB1489_16250, partial [Acidobacteriota bacterium]